MDINETGGMKEFAGEDWQQFNRPTDDAYPAKEFSGDTHLLKLQCQQNKVLHTIHTFSSHTPYRELCMYIYDYLMKLCSNQAEVVQNHENANVCDIRKGPCLIKKMYEA
jgi:hypothetical protein